MAKIVNYGSINIDHIYRVDHFVRPGETLGSQSLTTVLGGKGANQSVAIAQAGGDVLHIGRLGNTDSWALEEMSSRGVDCSHVALVEEASGHAIIQVDDNGENAIVLHGGANQSFDLASVEAVLQNSGATHLLLQNEVNLLPEVFAMAVQLGIKVVMNPAPMDDSILQLPLAQLDTLIVNQGEAEALSGQQQVSGILRTLAERLPDTRVVITLGAQGSLMQYQGEVTEVAATPVDVVDTTAAGDTFVGYLLAGLVAGLSGQQALERASRAAAIAVTRVGAIPSIPKLTELKNR